MVHHHKTVRHRERIFLLLHMAWDRKYGLDDCGLGCCHSWLSRYLKQRSVPVPIKKMWKEHCFYNEYTCLLSCFFVVVVFWSMVKLSFPNNNIKKLTLWIFTLYVTVLTSFQENDPSMNFLLFHRDLKESFPSYMYGTVCVRLFVVRGLVSTWDVEWNKQQIFV